jgi:hypothetical protein
LLGKNRSKKVKKPQGFSGDAELSLRLSLSG